MLRALRVDLGIESKRTGFQGGSAWSLPQPEQARLSAMKHEPDKNERPSPADANVAQGLLVHADVAPDQIPAGDAALHSRSVTNGGDPSRMDGGL
jgi:hypothetical protein